MAEHGEMASPSSPEHYEFFEASSLGYAGHIPESPDDAVARRNAASAREDVTAKMIEEDLFHATAALSRAAPRRRNEDGESQREHACFVAQRWCHVVMAVIGGQLACLHSFTLLIPLPRPLLTLQETLRMGTRRPAWAHQPLG